jgi:hypothetical protein
MDPGLGLLRQAQAPQQVGESGVAAEILESGIASPRKPQKLIEGSGEEWCARRDSNSRPNGS